MGHIYHGDTTSECVNDKQSPMGNRYHVYSNGKDEENKKNISFGDLDDITLSHHL